LARLLLDFSGCALVLYVEEGSLLKIIIDADACPRPVLHICRRLGKKYGTPLWTVASFEHCIESEHHVIVGNSPEETDIKLLNLSRPGDIAVTQDWGLAAMLLGKGVRCLSPAGKCYNDSSIDFLLEERNVKLRHRRGGGRTKGPKKRTAGEDNRFETALERLLQHR
jgi:uncharacterized protein YaiI (UPF0178 family)